MVPFSQKVSVKQNPLVPCGELALLSLRSGDRAETLRSSRQPHPHCGGPVRTALGLVSSVSL